MKIIQTKLAKPTWNEGDSLLKAIDSAVESKNFLGNNGAIARVDRLRSRNFSGRPNPELIVVEKRAEVHQAAYEFYNSLSFLHKPRATWFKSLADKYAKEAEGMKNNLRIHQEASLSEA